MNFSILSTTKRSKKERTSVMSPEAVFEAFRTPGAESKTVEAFRAVMPTLPPHFSWPQMHLLQRICPGISTGRRKAGKSTETYNGVVLLEIEGLRDLQEADEVKKKLRTLPTTLAAATGLSGHTVKLLVGGILDDGTLPKTQIGAFHAALYDAATRLYGGMFGVQLRRKEASPHDTFRWTYDPTAYYLPEAAPIRLDRSVLHTGAHDIDSETAQPYGAHSVNPLNEDSTIYRRRWSLAVEQAEETYELHRSTSQKKGNEEKGKEASAGQLLGLMSATAAQALRLGIPKEEAVWQAQHYYPWISIPPERIRAEIECTYDEESKAWGRDKGHQMQDIIFRLQQFMNERYDLRYNEMSNGVEYRPNNSFAHRFQPLDTRVMNTMIQEANEAGLEIMDRDMRRFLGSTRIRNFNVAQAFLREADGEWDGTTDHIKALANRIPTHDKRWHKWFHTWFLGMVAQWLGWSGEYANAEVPLLIGPQGCGKSTFGHIVLPPELRGIGYKELTDFSNKTEVERMLTTSLLINLDEFNQISAKTQQGFLKNLIQKSSIKGRRPYGSTIVNIQRTASFIATTNMSGVLADPTGSRRFIPINIIEDKQIDNSSPVPYRQLYGQAIQELKEGIASYLTPAEMAELEQHNLHFMEERPEIQNFLETFEPQTEETPETQRLQMSQIAEAVRSHTRYVYTEQGKHFLGRWLTEEERRGHIRKTRYNGRIVYWLKNAYK